MMLHYVYIAHSPRLGRVHIGMTCDLPRRLRQLRGQALDRNVSLVDTPENGTGQSYWVCTSKEEAADLEKLLLTYAEPYIDDSYYEWFDEEVLALAPSWAGEA